MATSWFRVTSLTCNISYISSRLLLQQKESASGRFAVQRCFSPQGIQFHRPAQHPQRGYGGSLMWNETSGNIQRYPEGGPLGCLGPVPWSSRSSPVCDGRIRHALIALVWMKARHHWRWKVQKPGIKLRFLKINAVLPDRKPKKTEISQATIYYCY